MYDRQECVKRLNLHSNVLRTKRLNLHSKRTKRTKRLNLHSNGLLCLSWFQQNGNQDKQSRSSSRTSQRGSWNKNGFHPQPINTKISNNRQQNNIQRNVAQQPATILQQNYTCSSQKETSWIIPQVQLQAIQVIYFNRSLS